MQVKVKLCGPLRKYQPAEEIFVCELQETVSVQSLLEKLAVPISSVSFVSIDGHKADFTLLLNGGELVVVYPRVSGG